jgi:hypothetical protein
VLFEFVKVTSTLVVVLEICFGPAWEKKEIKPSFYIYRVDHPFMDRCIASGTGMHE